MCVCKRKTIKFACLKEEENVASMIARRIMCSS